MGTLAAQQMYQRLRWTTKLRPMIVGAFVADMLAPQRRTIVETDAGFKFFVDPLSNLGGNLIKARTYEPETEQIIREHLSENEIFLDVGANEGYFSVLAASIVGPHGSVVAVEPQSRLCEIIQINLAINELKGNIIHGALGGAKGDHCLLNLYPSLNSGASSILHKPRLYRKVETAPFADPLEFLSEGELFSFVKVDVEGYEANVVQSLLPLLKLGKIRTLLVDFHASILQANKIDPRDIDQMILLAGMYPKENQGDFSGHRLYRKRST